MRQNERYSSSQQLTALGLATLSGLALAACQPAQERAREEDPVAEIPDVLPATSYRFIEDGSVVLHNLSAGESDTLAPIIRLKCATADTDEGFETIPTFEIDSESTACVDGRLTPEDFAKLDESAAS